MNLSLDQLDKWKNMYVKIFIVVTTLKIEVLNIQLELTKILQSIYWLSTPWYTHNVEYNSVIKKKELEKYMSNIVCI